MDDLKLENLTKKLFKDLKTEQPQLHFTEKVMQGIEQLKLAEIKATKPVWKNKFMMLFISTFGTIATLSLAFTESNNEKAGQGWLFDHFKLPAIDFGFFSKYLHVDFEIGFLAKLILGSVVLFIVFDLLSGRLIDRLIDFKTKRR
jgi:hypothetical protein